MIGHRFEFGLSDEVSLVHDPGAGEGKTACMGKGLFLCFRERICAGGSAGFGVPVFRTGRQTFFPTLVSLKRTGGQSGELVFALDRKLSWFLAGQRAPAVLTGISECLVEFFMRHAVHQALLLQIRDHMLPLCAAEGRILPAQCIGYCRVVFHLSGTCVRFRMNGSLKAAGMLTALNEADGVFFDVLRTGDRVQQGSRIPGWQEAGFDTELKSRAFGTGISLYPEGPDRARCRLFCGREVSRGLNWAGLALTGGQPALAYRLCIRP